MPGKRTTDSRAHHGPEEDRAHRLEGDRGKGKLRTRKPRNPDTEGLSAKDAERLQRFQGS